MDSNHPTKLSSWKIAAKVTTRMRSGRASGAHGRTVTGRGSTSSSPRAWQSPAASCFASLRARTRRRRRSRTAASAKSDAVTNSKPRQQCGASSFEDLALPRWLRRTLAIARRAPATAGGVNAEELGKTSGRETRFKHEGPPEKFTYGLAGYTVERRACGWFIAKTLTTFAGEKPNWLRTVRGYRDACLSIARRLFVELADRHTRSIETHKIARTDPLYGLKPTTRLRR